MNQCSMYLCTLSLQQCLLFYLKVISTGVPRHANYSKRVLEKLELWFAQTSHYTIAQVNQASTIPILEPKPNRLSTQTASNGLDRCCTHVF
eukprot:m.71799 g.71799  ORF g.71799 m.71799 type:complete len:91 (+) comp14222_c0_seq44:1215-1487(+)